MASNKKRPTVAKVKKNIYLGNPQLKKIGVPVAMSQDDITEYQKCQVDPIYFAQNYVKIVTLDHGFVPINLYPFQKDSITKVQENRFVIMKAGRQVGKTTMVVAYILWYILFSEDKTVAILANKAKTSREILNRIQIAYEALPMWLQQGVKEWNKGFILLENQCKVFADSTASSAARGFTINFLYLDEYAFVPNNIADEFFTSVYPTISSGKTSKVLISSTPNGMNHFYRMWKEQEQGINGFIGIEANWRQVPGRTEEWAAQQKKALGEQKYMQEMECSFLGSSGTLISATALKNMAFIRALKEMLGGLEIYEEPKPDHFYVQAVDCSRGSGLDYSAFVVVDVTEHPYKVVAKYKNNVISPLLFPNVIVNTAKWYNNAWLVVENNDIGGQVVDLVCHELEYENVFHGEESNGKYNLTAHGRTKQLGLKTTKKVKRQGCNALKDLIENQKLIITDFNIIEDLSTFVVKNHGYYAAEEGMHDDLVMCLVLFSWLTIQPFFKDMTNHDIRKRLFEERMRAMEDEMPPLPATSDDISDNPKYFRQDSVIWETVMPGDGLNTEDYYGGFFKDFGNQ